MEIIITRMQLSLASKDKAIEEINKQDISGRYYFLFNECNKVTFRDDNGEEIVLKDRGSKFISTVEIDKQMIENCKLRY